MTWFRRRTGISRPVLVLFSITLLHFLVASPQNLLLKNIPISFLIITLFVVQSILLKMFLEASNIKNKANSIPRAIDRIPALQPLVFSLIFLATQMLTVQLRGLDGLLSLVEDPQSFAYYSLALRISDPLTYMREWLALMQVPLLYWGGHLATHFPGYPFMIYFGFHLFGASPQSVIWLTILLSTLALLPLFYLARLVYGSKAATVACVLYMSIPSVSMGLPYMESTVGIFTTTALLLFIRSLSSESKMSLSLLGGLIFSFATFLTFASASLLVPIVIVAISARFWRKVSTRLLSFISATFVPYLVAEVMLGMPLYEAASWAFRTHNWFHYHLHSLGPSVWSTEMSALLFFLLLGLPVCLVFLVAAFRGCSSLLRQTKTDTFALASSLMLLIVILLARLELSRVALFTVVMLVTCVAGRVVRWKPEGSLYANTLLLSFAQFLETYSYMSQASMLSRSLGYPIV